MTDKKPQNATTVRFDDEEKQIIAALIEDMKEENPRVNQSDIFRLGIRALAKQRKVSVKKK